MNAFLRGHRVLAKGNCPRGQFWSPFRQTAPWPKALATLPFSPGSADLAMSTVVDIAQAWEGHPEEGCAEFGARTLQRRSLLEPENRLERGRLARRGHPCLFFSSLLRFTASGRLATHGPFVAEWISGPLLHHLPNGNHEHKAQDRHPKP